MKSESNNTRTKLVYVLVSSRLALVIADVKSGLRPVPKVCLVSQCIMLEFEVLRSCLGAAGFVVLLPFP